MTKSLEKSLRISLATAVTELARKCPAASQCIQRVGHALMTGFMDQIMKSCSHRPQSGGEFWECLV